MKKETARAIVEMARTHGDRLCGPLQHIKEQGTAEEFEAYRRAVAHVLADMDYEVLRHIVREHPELEPEEWKIERTNVPPIPNPIATRELWTIGPEDKPAPVKVLLAAPAQGPAILGGHECAFQILGLGNEIVQKRFGPDSMTALLSALKAIGKQLQEQREQGRKIWWLDEDDPMDDLGLPVPFAASTPTSNRNG